MKKVQILINHCEESIDVVTRMLESINDQSYKDLEVIICTDNDTNLLTEYYLSQFSVPIQYIYHHNKGIGATRNVLLNAADAKYVMFCDVDDCFVDTHGVEKLVEVAESQRSDVIGSAYKEEIKKLDEFVYIIRRHDTIRVHGKMFLLSYLRDNNIHFLDEMKKCGDQYFLWLAFNLTNRIHWVPTILYMWRWNDISVTRNAPHFRVCTHPMLLKTYTLLIEDLIKRGRDDLCRSAVCGVINMCFSYYHSDRWKIAPEEYVRAANSSISEYIISYRYIYDCCDTSYLLHKFQSRQSRNGEKHSYEELEQWLDAMEVYDGC